MITGRFAAMTARVAAANSISLGGIARNSTTGVSKNSTDNRRRPPARPVAARESRPAQRRIGERNHCSWKGGQQLRGMDDPIEIARNRSETIVGGNCAVSGRFHLLKDRIRVSGNKDITRKEENREPIDVRQRRGSEKIGGSRSDGSRARHHPAPKVRFRVSDRSVRHRLFIMCAKVRQLVPILVESLPKTSHVAVSKNREYSAEERHDLIASRAFDSRAQAGQIADQGLRRGQAHRAAFGDTGPLR